MCGITGILNLNGAPINQETLQRMTDAVAHRGPDNLGLFVDDNIGLGHTRLAILDLTTAANQPMSSSCNSYHLTYNGQVYNYKEIRIELEKDGIFFETRSDTEVVLKAMIRWGSYALPKFNGMFALAFWDGKSRELLIARDRHGVKPLYYANLGKSFLFASECKSIFKHDQYVHSTNIQGLVEYLTFQNIISDNTTFKNIKVLPHGSFIKVSSSGKISNINRYWDFVFEEPGKHFSDSYYTDRVEHLFKQAVTKQIDADVDVGAYLSGGFDSGSICSVASKLLPGLQTFTIGFDLSNSLQEYKSFDERSHAELMSSAFGTEHYQMVLKANDMKKCLGDLSFYLEEPRVGQSYPNYYAAKLASKFVKVVLSGTGGDELFAGYPWRYKCLLAESSLSQKVDNYYKMWCRAFEPSQIKTLLKPVWSEAKHVDTKEIFDNIMFSNKGFTKTLNSTDLLNLALRFEAKTFLQGLLLVEDKLSMSQSMETRVPFLDNELVEFALAVPVRKKIAFGMHRSPDHLVSESVQGKLVFRKAMEQELPKEIMGLKKQGFSAPDHKWLKDYLTKIDKKRLIVDDSIDSDNTKVLLNEILSNNGLDSRSRSQCWSLVALLNKPVH